MASVSAINVAAAQLMQAGTTVAGHLEVAAKPPVGVVPGLAAASPVDVAAGQAAAAIHSKMTAMHSTLASKGLEMHAAAASSAGALQAQDARNASPLKDLASAVPSGGSSGGCVSNGSSGQGKIQAFDNHWKQGPDQPGGPGRHPDYPDHKLNGKWAPGNSGADGDAAAKSTFDNMEKRGIPLERREIQVKVTDPATGKTYTRYYDALRPTGEPGQYVGIEHKVNASPLTPNQEIVDGLVNSGTPAEGTLDGKPIQVTRAQEIRVDWPPPDGVKAGESVGPKAPVAEPIPEAPPAAALRPEPAPATGGFGAGPSQPIGPQLISPGHHVPHIVGDWDPDREEIP